MVGMMPVPPKKLMSVRFRSRWVNKTFLPSVLKKIPGILIQILLPCLTVHAAKVMIGDWYATPMKSRTFLIVVTESSSGVSLKRGNPCFVRRCRSFGDLFCK